MTVSELYRRTKAELEALGNEAAPFESAALIQNVCGFSRSDLIINPNAEAEDGWIQKIGGLVKQRAEGVPLQYLLGEWSFLGSVFKVGQGVLIPRDDTEVAVEAACEFLDLCSGSGIIAVTLKKLFPDSSVTALEISPAALSYLKENAKLNRADIEIIGGDVFSDFEKFSNARFDLIISNPPYIKTDDIASLQREVQFEPKLALDGGADGLDFYRTITKNWSRKLKSGGMLIFELGENEADAARRLMLEAGFTDIRTHPDLGGTYRAINGTMP